MRSIAYPAGARRRHPDDHHPERETEMTLKSNWRQVLRRAWSVRLMALAAVMSGVEIALPILAVDLPRALFAVLTFLTVSAAFVARFIAQKGI